MKGELVIAFQFFIIWGTIKWKPNTRHKTHSKQKLATLLLRIDTAICRVGDMHSENVHVHTVVSLLLRRWAELILQPFRHFTYVTTHSPTLPSLYVRRSSFFNPSIASPTSQFIFQPFFRFSYVTSSLLKWALLILQPFRRFTYVAAHSPTLPLLHLRHNSFSNPSFASPTSQALHLIHLASRPWL